MRDGQCAAAVRAVNGARGFLDHRFSNLATAALCCGSCASYIRAAIVLLKSENAVMLERALRGEIPLLAAAAQTQRIAKLVNAYRAASAADRVAFARTVGPTTLFDSTLVPAL
jgi:hypothetical protein